MVPGPPRACPWQGSGEDPGRRGLKNSECGIVLINAVVKTEDGQDIISKA